MNILVSQHYFIKTLPGDNGYPKACNESQIEMNKNALVNTAQEKDKKKKYKVCLCWAVRSLTSEVFK